MNWWQLIFKQSKVNSGEYYGDLLPIQNWEWPRNTWFQARLRHLRDGHVDGRELSRENLLRFH